MTIDGKGKSIRPEPWKKRGRLLVIRRLAISILQPGLHCQYSFTCGLEAKPPLGLIKKKTDGQAVRLSAKKYKTYYTAAANCPQKPMAELSP